MALGAVRHRRGPRLLVGAVVAFAGLLSGCGGSDPEATSPGSLADAAPATADVFLETVIRPDDEASEGIDRLIEHVGGDADEEREALAEQLFATARQEFSPGARLTYEDDVEPWLGYRIGGFVEFGSRREVLQARTPSGDLSSSGGTAVLIAEVTDAEAARETLETAFGESEHTSDATLYEDSSLTSVALTEDRLLIGDQDGVDDAVAALDGSEPLSDSAWFDQGLETLDENDHSAFLIAESEKLLELSLLVEGPRFAQNFGPPLLRRMGIDLDEPLVVGLGIDEEGSLILDSSMGMLTPPDLATSVRLFEQLPADAWLAASDPLTFPTYVQAATVGLELGFSREGHSTAELVNRLGYDPIASIEQLTGQGALFAAGEDLADLRAGVLLQTKRGGDHYAANAARLLAAGARATILPGAVPYGEPFSFRAKLPPVPGEIAVTEKGNRLGVVTGYEGRAIAEAFEPQETFGESDAATTARERLGDDWELIGYADVDRALSLAAAADPRLMFAGAQVPDGMRILMGARADGRRLTERYVVAFE